MNSLTTLPRERQCHTLLFKLAYGSTVCPVCRSKLLFRRRYAWCASCRRKHSAKAATWLRQSNLTFQQLWLLIWCWQQKQTPGSACAIAGVSYPTVRRWFERFRRRLPVSNMQLSGVVEVDEAFFGKQRYGRQTMVVGAIERDTRRLRLQVIPDREQDTLELFLTTCVTRQSLILTDAHAGYSDLEFYGYAHERCNHSLGHFGPTNQIENTWGVMKQALRRAYGKLTVAGLPDILREWEQRHNQPDLFYNPKSYLQQCLVTS
jgi:transposase-like protein